MSFGLELGILLEETSICISSLDEQDLFWFKVENGNASSDTIRSLSVLGLKYGGEILCLA